MKPSKITVIKAKKALLLLPGFRAVTWKGVVYCKKTSDINLINAIDAITSDFETHEAIHVRQAESTHDSWFVFYVLYLFQWICNFPLFFTGWMMPYRFISFELEAAANELNRNYPTNGPVYEWKDFNKLTLKEKYKLAKEYNKRKRNESFKSFVRNTIHNVILTNK